MLPDESEEDMRFVYCGVAIEKLLSGFTEESTLDHEAILEYCKLCITHDGAFSWAPWAESHSGLTYCALGTLRMLDQMHIIEEDKLVSWICHHQCGGFTGRTEKFPPDTCYSFFNCASLSIIDPTLVNLVDS